MSTPSGRRANLINGEAMAPDLESALVYAFKRPHRIGSICRPPCIQCGSGNGGCETTDEHGNDLDPVAFYIMAEASKGQWREHIRQCGGGEVSKRQLRIRQYYYFVTTD